MLLKTFLFTSFTVLLIFSPVSAQMYQCKVGGKIIFTDQPCNGSAPPEEPYRSTPTENVENQPAQSNNDEQKKIDARTAVKLEMRYLELIDQQKRLEENLKAKKIEMDQELAELKNKKNYANNNLAGAVWEESISKEMEAVTKKHLQRIDHAKELVDKKKEEREATKAELQKYKEVYY